MTATAVVGGGMLGLTVALRLAERGDRVTVIEAAPELGGLAAPWTLGGVRWDRHYHVTLASDVSLRGLLRDLGLDDRIRWVTTSTGFSTGGEVHPVNGPLDFLRLPSLGVVDKARLAGTLAYGTLIRDGRRLGRVPVERWLRRWSGDRTYERFWLPLLRAKLGAQHELASASFIWATIQRLTRARRNGLAEERFGYVPGGYATVLSALADRLGELGVDVRLDTPVCRIEGGSSPSVHLARGGEPASFDRVVVTVAPPIAARIVAPLTGDERGRLEAVRMQGIACLSLLLDGPLTPHYLTYVTDPECPFTAVVDMTALVGVDELGGHGLVYLPKYVVPDDPVFDRSDDDLVAEFTSYLRRLHPGATDDRVVASRVSRVRHVMAVPTVDAADRPPPSRLAAGGVHLASSAHLVDATLNVDETVALAEQTAAVLG